MEGYFTLYCEVGEEQGCGGGGGGEGRKGELRGREGRCGGRGGGGERRRGS